MENIYKNFYTQMLIYKRFWFFSIFWGRQRWRLSECMNESGGTVGRYVPILSLKLVRACSPDQLSELSDDRADDRRDDQTDFGRTGPRHP